jgi:hypothetical protein
MKDGKTRYVKAVSYYSKNTSIVANKILWVIMESMV